MYMWNGIVVLWGALGCCAALLSAYFAHMPRYVQQGLHYCTQDTESVMRHVCCVEDSVALRAALEPMGLVAFVANGAILPRCVHD